MYNNFSVVFSLAQLVTWQVKSKHRGSRSGTKGTDCESPRANPQPAANGDKSGRVPDAMAIHLERLPQPCLKDTVFRMVLPADAGIIREKGLLGGFRSLGVCL